MSHPTSSQFISEKRETKHISAVSTIVTLPSGDDLVIASTSSDKLEAAIASFFPSFRYTPDRFQKIEITKAQYIHKQKDMK